MMTKPECERAFRRYCKEWADETGFVIAPENQPSYFAFLEWLKRNRKSECLEFRSRVGSDYETRNWFDDEFNQTWRN